MLPIIIEPLIKIALMLGGPDDGGGLPGAGGAVGGRPGCRTALGPNRVGIPLTKIRLFGLGQPLADGVKFVFKEEVTPGHVDKLCISSAPTMIFVAAHGGLRRDPLRQRVAGEPAASWGVQRPIHLIIAPDIDVGVVYVFAVGSIAVYGVMLGGWASNNKYSFLGGMREQRPVDRLRDCRWAWAAGRGAVAAVRCGWTTIIAPAGGKRRLERFRAAAGASGLRRGRLCRGQPGCPSTCPRPSRNWSAATTPSIPASS